MFRWYVVNTYSGHENKVKQNLEHRRSSMGQEHAIRRIVVPTEHVVETKDGQSVSVEKRVLPGYVLVQMDLSDDSWHLVKGTPGVTGFVGSTASGDRMSRPVALSQPEVDRILHTSKAKEVKAKAAPEFTLGQPVKVTSGPLSDFDGEIIEINAESGKLKVHVSIFERQVPVELTFDQVKKLD